MRAMHKGEAIETGRSLRVFARRDGGTEASDPSRRSEARAEARAPGVGSRRG